MLVREEVLMQSLLSNIAAIKFLASSFALLDTRISLQKLRLLHYCCLEVGLVVLS
jgi:hypothetical protein